MVFNLDRGMNSTLVRIGLRSKLRSLICGEIQKFLALNYANERKLCGEEKNICKANQKTFSKNFSKNLTKKCLEKGKGE